MSKFLNKHFSNILVIACVLSYFSAYLIFIRSDPISVTLCYGPAFSLAVGVSLFYLIAYPVKKYVAKYEFMAVEALLPELVEHYQKRYSNFSIYTDQNLPTKEGYYLDKEFSDILRLRGGDPAIQNIRISYDSEKFYFSSGLPSLEQAKYYREKNLMPFYSSTRKILFTDVKYFIVTIDIVALVSTEGVMFFDPSFSSFFRSSDIGNKEEYQIEDSYFKTLYLSASITGLGNSGNVVYVGKLKDSNCLAISPSLDNVAGATTVSALVLIEYDDILYFDREGEIFHENKIYGGGGGGSSVKGAILGGAIAGDVGAIIGSRSKVNPIYSEMITHDTRKTTLYYMKNGEKHYICFPYNAYDVIFKEYIPEKEYVIVEELRRKKIVNKLAKRQED